MNKKLISFIAVLLFVAFNFSALAQEEDLSRWSNDNLSKWFHWKEKTNLNEKQRSVIEYLNKSSEIYSKAFETRCVQPNSDYGYPDPKKALKIVEQSINQLKKLPCPQECREYRDMNIKVLEYTISYHKLRIKYKEGTKEFNTNLGDLELAEIKDDLNNKRFNAYLDSMRNVGLFDNIEQEMRELQEK